MRRPPERGRTRPRGSGWGRASTWCRSSARSPSAYSARGALGTKTEPTAHALRAETVATPQSWPPGGPDTRVQVTPFQCKISESSMELPLAPTAQALPAEVAATPSTMLTESAVLTAPGGLDTWVQVRPFQCKISGMELPFVVACVSPTAQALPTDPADTAVSSAAAPGLGLGTCAQVLPLKCTIRVLVHVLRRPPLPRRQPTAQTSLSDVAVMA